jgi:PAS domain S-box-containing protein
MQELVASLWAVSDPADALPTAVRHVARLFGAARGSLVLLSADGRTGFIVASSEEPNLQRVPFSAARQPALQAAVAERTPRVCLDVGRDALLSDAPAEGGGGGPAVWLFPTPPGQANGALVIEAPGDRELEHPSTLQLGIGCAAIIASALSSSRLLEELRERTNPRHEVLGDRSLLAAIETYGDFFDAASDGMIVVDAEARILHVNRAAEHLTGWARDGLAGRSFVEFVAEPFRKSLSDVARASANGTVFTAFDLELLTTSGDPVVVSVATSSVLSDVGAVVLTFRDVTLERQLENELRTTKDFLERLIDSTIDAIVAADTLGTIIVFNSGAERIYGWKAEDVVGRMSVERLYPQGVAREVMRLLRSDDRGGIGRLEATRQLIVTSANKVVPVMLSAAIVYEEGREVATVGIFSDLRERILMEANLVEVREKLQISEKQALVAELAGTTAHELNQPLTSIMGYAELIKRRLPVELGPLPDPAGVRRALDIILREAERMAEIVRKIGRITRYETKAYVGDTRILDLEKSSE